MDQRTDGTVFVFGSINADTSYRVPTLPHPGETVRASSAEASPGGKGSNQAIAAVAAGAVTRMVGAVGSDSEATGLLSALAARGVDTRSISVIDDVLTGRAIVAVDDGGENSILVLAGANARLDADSAVNGLSDVGSTDVLVLQNEVPPGGARAAARTARDAGAMVIWNAAPAPATRDEIIEDVDLLVVNEHELERIAALLGAEHDPASENDEPMQRAASMLLRTLRLLSPSHSASGVCTLGADGALFVSPDDSGHILAPRVHAVDTTAAGDTVVGYLAALRTLPLRERLRIATAAGALTVTRRGASSSIPAIEDVELALASHLERKAE